MKLLIENLIFLIPIGIIMLIAILNGLRTGRFLKFLIAGLNLVGLFFLFFGLFYGIKTYFFKTSDETLTNEQNETTQVYNPEFLSKVNFSSESDKFFTSANIFLNFRGV